MKKLTMLITFLLIAFLVSQPLQAVTLGRASTTSERQDGLSVGTAKTNYGLLKVDKYTGGITWTPISVATGTGATLTPPTTTGAGWLFDFSALTTGDGLKLKAVNATLNGGKYLNVYGGTGTTSVFSIGENGVVQLGASAYDTGTILAGAGTSSSANTSSTANGRFLNFYLASSATSGDNRGIYLKTDFTGAGGGGDAARFYAVAKAAVGTIHGVHATGQIGTSGSITGTCVGVRATFATTSGVTTSGTHHSLRVDSDLGQAITGIGSFIGVYDVTATKMGYFLHFDSSVTTAIAADTSALPANATHKIRCRYGDTDFYLIGVADF